MPPSRSPAASPARRRRRPRQARAQATVDAILGGAARVLVRRGWAGLTTNHVAAAAGVSVGSVYEYFRDKQAILAALLEAHVASGEALLAARAATLLPGAESAPISRLVHGLVAAMLDLHEADPRLHRALSHDVPVPPALRARVAALEASMVDAVAGVLSRHPGTRAADPVTAARIVVTAVDALTHRWIVEPGGDPLPRATLEREITALVTSYLTGGMAAALGLD